MWRKQSRFRAAAATRGVVLGCWARAGELPKASGSARGVLPGRHRSPRPGDVGARRRPCGARPGRRPALGERKHRVELAACASRALLPGDPARPGRAKASTRSKRGAPRSKTSADRAQGTRGRPLRLQDRPGAARSPPSPALRRRGRRSAGRAARGPVARRGRVGARRPRPPRHAGQGDHRAARHTPRRHCRPRPRSSPRARASCRGSSPTRARRGPRSQRRAMPARPIWHSYGTSRSSTRRKSPSSAPRRPPPESSPRS